MTIHPPVIIENLLAIALEYELVDFHQTEQKQLREGKAKKGEVLHLHDMASPNAIGAKFKIDSGKYSSLLHLSGDKIDHSFQVFDQVGRELRIDIDNQVQLKTGIRVISIFTRYWMINKTGTRILYGYKGGNSLCANQRDIEKTSQFWSESNGHPRNALFGDLTDSDPLMISVINSKCNFMIANSEWSKDLPLTAQQEGTFKLNDLYSKRAYEVAVSISNVKSKEVS